MSQRNQSSVFVIGGVVEDGDDQLERMQDLARRLGAALGESGRFRIVACSAHSSSLDAGVIEGFACSEGDHDGSVVVHCPSDQRLQIPSQDTIRGQWRALVERTGLALPRYRENSSAKVYEPSDFPSAFLACQIRALRDDADVVVALGGKPTSSASNLLAVAHGQYPIASYATMGGAAGQEYDRQGSELRRRIRDHRLVDLLEASDGVDKVAEIVDKLTHVHAPYKVFISYAWEAKENADYVEAYLRRDNRVDVFRDEVDIRSGDSISSRVLEEIESCDVFLILWSSAYVASPWCRDEFLAASARTAGPEHYVLRLDDTRPSWEELRVDNSKDWEKKWLLAKDRESIATSLEEMLKLSEKPR